MMTEIKFRRGVKNEEIFSSDSLTGMNFDYTNAENQKLYYTEYDGDLYVVRKIKDHYVQFGVIEDENLEDDDQVFKNGVEEKIV